MCLVKEDERTVSGVEEQGSVPGIHFCISTLCLYFNRDMKIVGGEGSIVGRYIPICLCISLSTMSGARVDTSQSIGMSYNAMLCGASFRFSAKRHETYR